MSEANARRKIRSRSDLFKGELVEKPKKAKSVVYNANEEPVWKCPNCGEMVDVNGCDVIGAEPGCLFCNRCNMEFETI